MSIISSARIRLALLALSIAVPAVGQAGGATPAAPTNDDCLTCHSDAETKRANGTSLLVEPKVWEGSVHGQAGLQCVDCHADLAKVELPHGEKLEPVKCAACHEDAVAKYQTTVHGKSRAAGNGVAATCVDCHGSHDIRQSKDPESRTYHLSLSKTCGACHGNEQKVQQAHLPGGNIGVQFEDSIHGRALLRGGLLVAPSCASCHGAHDIRPHQDPESRVARAHIPATCGSCHEGVRLAFERGKHGEQLQKNNPSGPVCIDCHSAHHIQRAEMAAWKVDVIRECGRCHLESISTYRDTFHGQVTALGYARVASCADCHGAHDVLPKSDPRSPIHDANRTRTCQKCHPSANDNFAQYDPHANRHHRESGALLYYAGHFMDLLLLGVFGFFGIHTGLWFVRSWKERRAKATRAHHGKGAASRDDSKDA